MAADKTIEILVAVKDAASKALKTANTNLTTFEKRAKAVSKSLINLKTVIAGSAIGFIAKDFLSAASEAENYNTRLKAVLGSTAEANRLFKDMSKYAGEVPFQYKEIMGAATQLSGVMKGGVDEVKQWIPLIGDLAAVSGLSIQQTTEQVVRMYSAGAASADLFRERGITAMLGFQAGVSYSADETRKRLIEAWNDPLSKFKGATQDLAGNWTGILSMMSDAWFQFQVMVLSDTTLFETLKDVVANVTASFKGWMEANKELIKQKVNDAVDTVVKSFQILKEFLPEIIFLMKAFVATWVGLKAVNVAQMVGTFIKWLKTLTIATKGSTLAMQGLEVATKSALGVIGALLAGVEIGKFLNQFDAVKRGAQLTISYLEELFLRLTKLDYQIEATIKNFLGLSTDKQQAKIDALNEEIAINQRVRAEIKQTGQTEAEVKNKSVEVNRAAEAKKKAEIEKTLKELEKGWQDYGEKIDGIYEDQIRAAKLAGMEEKQAQEEIEAQVIALKSQQIEKTIQLLQNQTAVAKQLYGEEADEYKKSREKLKESENELSDLRLDALSKYQDAVKNTEQVESKWRSKVQDIEADLLGVRTQGLSEYQQAIQETERADELVFKARQLAQKDAVTYEQQIMDLLDEARDLYKQQNEAIEETVHGREVEKRSIEESLKIQESGLEDVLRVTQEVGKKQVDNAKEVESGYKTALDELESRIESVLGDPKQLNVDIDPDVETLQSQFDRLAADQTKVIRVKTIEEKASGGQIFPRRAGHLPGDGQEDNIPAMLMAGEYVVKKDAVKKYGPDLFSALNSMKMPVEALPGFALGGIVAVGKAIQRFATGGPASSYDRYEQNPAILRKIEDIESKITAFNEKTLGISTHEGGISQKYSSIIPDGNGASILSAKTPEDAIGKMQSILKNLKTKKSDLGTHFDDMILQAGDAGNSELVTLLRSEKDDVVDLAEDLQTQLETVMEEYKATIEQIREEQAQVMRTYEEAVEAQEQIQGNLKENIQHIKDWNSKQPATGFEVINFNEAKKMFKKSSDSSWQSMLSDAKLFSDEGTETFTLAKEWEKKFRGTYGAYGARHSFFDEKGNEWTGGPELPMEKTGTFYNPAMISYARNILSASQEEVDRLTSENDAALKELQNQSNTAKSTASEGYTEDLSHHRDVVSAAAVRATTDAMNVQNDMKQQITDLQIDREELLNDLENERREWETRMAELKAQRTGGATRFAKGGHVTGEGGVDNVPAMLTAGEYVVKKSSVDRIKSTFGSAFLDAVNNFNLPAMVHRFADGGMVHHESIQPSSGSSQKLGELNIRIGESSLPAMVSPDLAKQFVRQLKEAGYAT